MDDAFWQRTFEAPPLVKIAREKDPGAGCWERRFDSQQRVYWFNRVTTQTLWVNPKLFHAA